MRINTIKWRDSVHLDRGHTSLSSYNKMTLMTLISLHSLWTCSSKLMISKLLDNKKLKKRRKRSARSRQPRRQLKRKPRKKSRKKKKKLRRRRRLRLRKRERQKWKKKRRKKEKSARRKLMINWKWRPSKFQMIRRSWRLTRSPSHSPPRTTSPRVQSNTMCQLRLQERASKPKKKIQATTSRSRRRRTPSAVSWTSSRSPRILQHLACRLVCWTSRKRPDQTECLWTTSTFRLASLSKRVRWRWRASLTMLSQLPKLKLESHKLSKWSPPMTYRPSPMSRKLHLLRSMQRPQIKSRLLRKSRNLQDRSRRKLRRSHRHSHSQRQLLNKKLRHNKLLMLLRLKLLPRRRLRQWLRRRLRHRHRHRHRQLRVLRHRLKHQPPSRHKLRTPLLLYPVHQMW